MDISIIISTRNRSQSLARTLVSFQDVEVPEGVKAEILVMDNASTDDTPAVTRASELKNIEVRYLYEGRKGKCHALNSALAQARGQVMLFTDDDVAPAKDWLQRMGGPLLARECDGVMGQIQLGKELLRPWMTRAQKSILAFYDGPGEGALEFTGANMGVHRSVFERIPSFDPEIGPGALGWFEDKLFSLQLAEAGFRLRYNPEALMVHHPDPSRLLRRHCLSSGMTFGASNAYLLHHWQHEQVSRPRMRYCYLGLKLRLRRLLQPPPPLDAEGIPAWEMSYVAEMEKCRRFVIERRRPRNYVKHGLRKL